MIGFGLRLTLRGGREAAARLVIIAAAVALGVAMLLATLAGLNAVNSQNARYAWLETGAPGAALDRAHTDAAWWLLHADEFRGRLIGRVDVAATGPDSPVPPGIPGLPGPGQFYASPELSKLLRSTPADQLGERYPGRQVGVIGAAALPAPNSLLIIVGHPPAALAHVPGAREVTAISTTAPNSCGGASCIGVGMNAKSIDLILSVVTAALLFPVLIFIGVATRLSAARREQRFAALRLVGATPGQVAVISAVESTVAAGVGVAVGLAVFYLLRPAIATIPFTGTPFFTGDLVLNLPDVLAVVLGVPAAAAIAARLALRRTIVSPLGVTRRVTPPPPHAWRLIPLAAGLAELAWFAIAGRPATVPGQIQAFLPGILVTMAGLVLAGPWLTMVGSRLMARRAHRAAGLIAARRLGDNPQAGFRAISGLVLALFVTSVALGVITTIHAYEGAPGGDSAANRSTLVDQLIDLGTRPPSTTVDVIPTALLDHLRSIPGVHAVTIVHAAPATQFGPLSGVVSCAQLARTPALGRCPADVATALTDPTGVRLQSAPPVWPAATLLADQLSTLPVDALAVATDGSPATLEQARTVLQLAYPNRPAPTTIAESYAQLESTKRLAGYQRLADVVILASLPIAGCTLAISVIAGLNDRKRPFSLLRLTGAPLGMLRRVITLESAVPLLVSAMVSIATGFLAAYLFLRAQLDETLQAPGLAYCLIVAAGLTAALAIIASTLPLLKRITGPETVRNE